MFAVTHAEAWAQAPGPQSAPPAAAPVLDEIVVTARRRSESLQQVPVAVTALTGADLLNAGALSTTDLPRQVAGLYYSDADPSKPEIYIRGVGTRSFDAGSESSVATFIDGVYIGRFGTQIQNIADVERVEVLKGPQGALFGRNTIGGAINIVTRKPGNAFEADASVTAGAAAHFGGKEIDGSLLIGGPVASTVGAQFAAAVNYADGPLLDIGTDKLRGGGGEESFRGRVVWQPAAGWEVDFAADASQTLDANLTEHASDVGGARSPVFLAARGLVSPVITDPYRTTQTPGQGDIDIKGQGSSVTATYTGSGVDFTSITAWRHTHTNTSDDLDGTALNIINAIDDEATSQYSQELRMASRAGGDLTFGDRIDWLFGLYYYWEHVDGHNLLAFGPAASLVAFNGGAPYTDSIQENVRTRSDAAFGQVGLKLTDQLKLDLALRYSHDDKSAQLAAETGASRIIATAPYNVSPSRVYSAVDPTTSLSYTPAKDLLLYASYAKGFKAGAFQFNALSGPAASVVAAPESLDAYQAGFKQDLLDKRLRIDLAAFYYRYNNLQVQRFAVPPGGTVPVATTVNAAKSTIKGLEIEGTAILSRYFRIQYGYSYLDARYDNYIFSSTEVFSGNRMTRAPQNTANLALVFQQSTAWGGLEERGSALYVDRYYFEADNARIDPGTREPAHTTFDASVALTRDPIKLTLWGRNLSDEEVRTAVASTSGYRLLETWAPRRTVGITVAVNW